MSQSLAEKLTTQFYDWEKRGRGWNMYDVPIDLEPTFVPFFFHGEFSSSFVDDGKRHTLVSKIIEFFSPKPFLKMESPDKELENSEINAFPFNSDESLKVLQVALPKGYKVKIGEMEQLLIMLSYCKCPISFEIIATHSKIVIQFVCRASDLQQLSSQLKAYFPESVINDMSDTLFDIIVEDKYAYCIDFGLKDEFMRPLHVSDNFELDPFIGLFGVLDNLKEDQKAVIQILFSGTLNPWAESIMRSVTDNDGGAFFMDAPDMLPLAKEKVAHPLFSVAVRALTQADSHMAASGLANSISNSLKQLSSSKSNCLIHLSKDFETHVSDFINRESHRLGMLLNSRELATFVHFPSASVVSSKLVRDTRKTRPMPQIAIGHNFVLGRNIHHGKETNATVSELQRLKHTHIIGATGTGKSTLLLNLIAQDISNGNGIAVLDPHGDLIESILSTIPENRYEDVILIDPSDSEFPVAFNILSAHSEIEKDILSSDLVAVFKRLSTSWGDQMNSVFANAILAFLESTQGGTLADLRRFLIEKEFRDSFLKTVSDSNVVYYWQKEFPILKSSSIGPILTRLDSFLRPKLIRHMVAQKKSLDFENILDSGKILLVKLSQGLMGAENSYLLGSFFVTKIYQAAMARQAKNKEARRDFFLYIDEFQNFITPSMSAILSGARKYHLGLILAHQDMQQLIRYDGELASSVLSNSGTRLCFRIGDADAKKLAEGFSFFEAADLQNLNTGEAIARIDRPENDFNITTIPVTEVESTDAERIKNNVIAISRNKYGTPKEEVEIYLRESIAETKESVVFKREEVKVYKTPEPKPIAQRVEIPATETKENLVKKKEESQHRYLQTLIKRMAESRGFKATIEEPISGGKGLIDVSLERNGKKIACEISVTTTDKWELHNIEKCLAAGYETVIVCSEDKKTLEKIQALVKEKITSELQAKIFTLEPDALFLYLDQLIAEDSSTETKIKGYRVKVEYKAVSEKDMQRKKEVITKSVLDSIKKKKGL